MSSGGEVHGRVPVERTAEVLSRGMACWRRVLRVERERAGGMYSRLGRMEALLAALKGGGGADEQSDE
jgi:hypothetical protein